MLNGRVRGILDGSKILSSGKETTSNLSWSGFEFLFEYEDQVEEELYVLDKKVECGLGDPISIQARVNGLLDNLLKCCSACEARLNGKPDLLNSLQERFQWRLISIKFMAQSPFMRQIFIKPYGYAGDHKVIDMIYTNEPAGNGIVPFIETYCYNTPACQSVRNRKEFVKRLILQESTRKRDMQVFNLASGPAREIAELACDSMLYGHVRILNIDHEPEAHVYAKSLMKGCSEWIEADYAVDSAFKIALRDSNEKRYGFHDMVICAGLLDYLSEKWAVRLMKVLYGLLRPGGLLVAGNFSTANPTRVLMEWAVNWHIIHRSEEEFRNLFEKAGLKGAVIDSEPLGINLFGVVRKV